MDFHSTLEDTEMIAQARIQWMISQDPIDHDNYSVSALST